MNSLLFYMQDLLFWMAAKNFPFVEEVYWHEEMERAGWTEEEIGDEEDRIIAQGGSCVMVFDVRHVWIFGFKTSFWDV